MAPSVVLIAQFENTDISTGSAELTAEHLELSLVFLYSNST